MTDAPVPWTAGAASASGALRHAPATVRNRDAIVEVLREALPPSGLVLEVASGSGEHSVYFAAAFPHLDWQPTDADPSALESIVAWREEVGLPNLRAPLALERQRGTGQSSEQMRSCASTWSTSVPGRPPWG